MSRSRRVCGFMHGLTNTWLKLDGVAISLTARREISRLVAMHLYAILYLLASLIVGLLAGDRRLGFWGGFFGSLLLTPVLGLLFVFLSAKNPAKRRS